MTGDKRVILVVDDVPDDIAILDEILKKDYQVKAVTNGEAALKIVRDGSPPDLILLDIMMPGMDGFEVCRRLKEDAEGAKIPVIFLTAKGMTADEKLGLELGAVDYIKKPIEPEIVISRIKSHLEHKDRILRSSEVRFRRLFETSADGIIIVDAETGMVIDVNPSLAMMMGLSQESFLGKRINDLDFIISVLSQKAGILDLHKQCYIRFKDNPLETADGRSIYVEFLCNPYRVNSRDVMQLNIRDITALVLAENERDKLTAKLSHYLSTSPTVTYSLKLQDGQAQWQWVSENVRLLLGFPSEEALSPDWWFRNINAAERIEAVGGISELVKNDRAVREYRFAKKDRSMVWLRDEMRLVREAGKEPEIVGTLTDITARKLAEAEIELKSAALEAVGNAVVITDRNGTIEWANTAFEQLSGYLRAEAIGKNPRELVKSGLQDASLYSGLWNTIVSGHVWHGELVNKKKSGELYNEEMTITPIMDAARRIEHYIAIKSDVTERIRSKERLEASLGEKEALMREIHHRVKDNMQVITSLLSLSCKDIEDPSTKLIFDELTRRIEAMATVHELFYKAENLDRIDFVLYLHQLISALIDDCPASPGKPVPSFETEETRLSLETAIPAGLIVSEFVSNALRFAFSGADRPGTLRIALRNRDDGNLEIEVRDDGEGLPHGFDPKTARSLGMELIGILSEQLHGTVSFNHDGGTVAVLRFPNGTGR